MSVRNKGTCPLTGWSLGVSDTRPLLGGIRTFGECAGGSGQETLQATSLQESRGPAAHFGCESQIFEGCEIDLYVCQGSGDGCASDGQGRSQIRFHVGVGNGF